MNYFFASTVSDIGQYLEGHPWLKVADLQGVVNSSIALVLVVAGVIFFFMLLAGGIQWMTAGGNQEALQAARKRLTTALIGIVIVFSAWAILNLVRGFFGLKTPGGSKRPDRFDCCQIVGGEMKNRTKCCQLAYENGCVSGRYQDDASLCSKLKIDWNCWAGKFGDGRNPDPNGYCDRR